MTLLPLTCKNPISLIFALTFPNPLATPSQYLTITFQPSPPTSSSSCHPSSRRRRLRLCRTSRPLRHNVFVGFVDELQRQQQHQHLPVFVFVATSTARRRRLWPSSHSDAAIHRRFGFHFRCRVFVSLHSQQLNQPHISWRNIEQEQYQRMHQQTCIFNSFYV
ncbi:hypothetical protein LWI29_004048 [Acer saccharum]|uniref:Uncharacterized protein n=1 Tax=Acer saccharum TaxID=4024 RepID=A0AA39VUL5_ACESA|nr:hypothetical protein LWI29_004048 [Acer saccharum]